jgi:uncharacterized phiE125 gp8 family phage protein
MAIQTDITVVGNTTYLSLITNDVLMSQFLRTDDTSFDATLVEIFWNAACQHVEDYTGAVLRPCTLTMYWDELPESSNLKLVNYPITAITSISTKVSSDSYTVYSSANYTSDLVGRAARVKFITDPDYTTDYLNAVKLIATVGYATAAAIPRTYIAACLLLCAHLYENRTAGIVGTSTSELPLGLRYILDNLRAGVML